MIGIREQLNPRHEPTITRSSEWRTTVPPGAKGPRATGHVHQVTTYLAHCPACDWIDKDLSIDLIERRTLQHTWTHHPDLQPPPEPPPPPHQLHAIRRSGTDLKLSCTCGNGWTGHPRAAVEAMAHHLDTNLDTIVEAIEEHDERQAAWAAEHGIPPGWLNR